MITAHAHARRRTHTHKKHTLSELISRAGSPSPSSSLMRPQLMRLLDHFQQNECVFHRVPAQVLHLLGALVLGPDDRPSFVAQSGPVC